MQYETDGMMIVIENQYRVCSMPGHIAVHSVVVGPLLDVVAVHAVVLPLAGVAHLHVRQLLHLRYAFLVLTVLRARVFFNWMVHKQACVCAILGAVLFYDHRFGETFGLRVVIDQVVYALVIAEALRLVFLFLLLLHETVALVVAFVEPVVIGFAPFEIL